MTLSKLTQIQSILQFTLVFLLTLSLSACGEGNPNDLLDSQAFDTHQSEHGNLNSPGSASIPNEAQPMLKNTYRSRNGTIISPSITSQPKSVSVYIGASVSFSVSVSGTTPITYQWRKAGVAISGATSSSYSISSVVSSDAANYSVVVKNSGGRVTSNAAALTVQTSDPNANLRDPCRIPVTVSIAESEIDCAQSRFYCVDSTRSGGGYYATIQAAINAVGTSAGGKVVVVYGNTTGTPREYYGFAIVGNGAGNKGQASHGGTGNSANERFIVKAVGSVVLKRRSATSTDAAILVQDTDYVTIDGFTVDREVIGTNTSSYTQAGVRVTDTDWRGTRPSYGIQLVNLSIRKGSVSNLYSANVSDVVIEKSRFTESLASAGYSNGGMLLYLSNGPSDNTIVRCNYFADSHQMAIHSNGGGDLIEGQLFEYNVFRNISGHGIHFQDGRNMVVRNNIFATIGKSAVTAWGINYIPEHYEIYNNLFYNAALSSPSAVQFGTESYPGDKGRHAIWNNLFIGNTQGNDITIRSAGPNVVASNYDQLANPVTTTAVSTGSVATSVFVDYANNDFRLVSTAQRSGLADLGVRSLICGGAELISVPQLDFLSNPRGVNAVTVGPYEY